MNKLKNASFKKCGRNIKGKSLFVETLNWKLILPTPIAYYFLDKLKEGVPFPNFKVEIALYYLSLISSIPTRKKDQYYYRTYVPLYSKFLKSINYQYKKYFEYFLEIGIVEKLNHDTWRKRSTRFRYNYNTIKREGTEFLNFDYFTFGVSREKDPLDANFPTKNAIKSSGHLAQWFDHGLHIDYERFLKDSKDKFSINKFNDEADNYAAIMQAHNYFYQAYEFSEQNFRVSRNPETDNRFHSNLTNMPKGIRQYIRYQNEEIIGLDIKNSQPYFLILMIENLLKNPLEEGLDVDYRVKRISNIFRRIYSNKSTMLQRLSQCTINRSFADEYSEIKAAVLSGKYYEFLGDVFSEIKPIEINPEGEEIYEGSFYSESRNFTLKQRFVGKRDLMKKVSMQLLYTPLKRPSLYYKIFKKQFPMICEFMEILKSGNKSTDAYKKFPRLLQHYEADCLLDVITKQVAEKYPDMPLYTIHDSIATTWMWFPQLEHEVLRILTEYSGGMPPILSVESWNPNYDFRNVA